MEANNAKLGTILVDKNGMTLYIFLPDKNAASPTCNGACATIWPPLTVAAGASPIAGQGVTGVLSTIKRQDGTMQVTYDGMPLYLYSGDKAAGDVNGQGFLGKWFAAVPSGAVPTAAPAATATPSGY
ncbi:MAG: hypothetical protein M1281_19025 [Chloroflexi bacterium]|nr:hypothetical protein [Chloroflexota bacterium]